MAGVAAGFVGSVTGGAGILLIPALIFLGLPANQAIATNTLATFGMTAASLPQYAAAKQVRWRAAFKLIPLAIIGGFVGSKVLTHVDADALTVVVGVLLLIMAPIIVLNPHAGLKSYKPSVNRSTVGYLLFLVVMTYGGFLGAGAGLFGVYILIFCLGMTYIESKATVSVPWLFLTSTAFIVFVAHGLVNWHLGILMTIGMFIGGFLGARAALEKGNAWVRAIFILVTLVASAKLLFFR